MTTVLFCSQSSEIGGAEVMLRAMTTSVHELGMEPHVALGGHGPLRAALDRDGIPVHELPFEELADVRRKGTVLRSLASIPAVWHVARATRDLARSVGADVVVTNSEQANIASSVGAMWAGRPVLWRMHDIVSPQTFGPAQRLALRGSAVVAGPRVLAVSGAAADGVRRYLGVRDVKVILNGIDRSRVVPRQPRDIRAELGWPKDVRIVGMLSRLARWKGGEAFVEAARILAERTDEVCFLVVGDPMPAWERAFKEELERRVKALGLDHRLAFLPFQEDVAAILQNYDLLVQPSLEPDPLPLSVMEALACGVPVVAFDHGGPPELVTHGETGRLVPVGDVQALADAAYEVVMDRDRWRGYSETAREVAKRFDSAVMCREIADEIAALSRAGRRRSRAR